MPSLWLVDGSHAIFRAYHALPHLSTRSGVPTNAVYGFTTMLLRAIREGSPTHLAVAFDEEAKAKRSEIYSEYKATRGAAPEDLSPQFPLVRRVLEALRVPAVGFPGYEADDVIATLARRARAQGWEVVIVTGDKDLMQLVDDSLRSYDSMYEKWYGPKEVEEKWGVPPHQLSDLLALTGDKIDNIPGVPGVGEKTAASLLKEYGSLDAVLENAASIKKPKLRENLLASLDKVRTARRLIALYDDLPLPVQLDDLERKPIDEPKARTLFTELEFVRLVKDLPRPPPAPPSGARALASDLAAVEKLVAKARAAGRFALLTLTTEDEPLRDELLGLAISLPDESVYVPLGHRPHGASGALFAPAELSAQKAIALLKPLLEDASVIKDGHDLKRDLDAWRRAGVDMKGLGIDARLASYLLDPTGRDHSLAQTARERISCELPLLKDLCEQTGKGKKATPLPEVPVDLVSAAACALVEGARRLSDALGEDLRNDKELWTLYSELELPLVSVLAGLELSGINLDTARLRKLSDEVEQQIDALLKEIFQLAGGEFLPASTQQLGDVLYKRLGLPVLKRGKTGPSTDQEVLEKVAAQHPLPEEILEHRQLKTGQGRPAAHHFRPGRRRDGAPQLDQSEFTKHPHPHADRREDPRGLHSAAGLAADLRRLFADRAAHPRAHLGRPGAAGELRVGRGPARAHRGRDVRRASLRGDAAAARHRQDDQLRNRLRLVGLRPRAPPGAGHLGGGGDHRKIFLALPKGEGVAGRHHRERALLRDGEDALRPPPLPAGHQQQEPQRAQRGGADRGQHAHPGHRGRSGEARDAQGRRGAAREVPRAHAPASSRRAGAGSAAGGNGDGSSAGQVGHGNRR